MKNSLLSVIEDINKEIIGLEREINSFGDGYRDRKIDSEDLIKSGEDILERMNSTSISIKNGIDEIRDKNNETPIVTDYLDASIIIADYIIQSLDKTVQVIHQEEKITEDGIKTIETIIDNVVEKTSLDLLFVMDITGSMGPYLSQAKQNILNIINKIIIECPGIDINLGFIGYRDIKEHNRGNYINIGFTQNHLNLQNSIKNIEEEKQQYAKILGEFRNPEDYQNHHNN